jgi:bacterioferritin (cytochrome b1)
MKQNVLQWMLLRHYPASGLPKVAAHLTEAILVNSKQSIELLNKSVADELAAVHQYMYFHFHLDDLGFAPLANLFKRIAIVEMGHVEALAERILFLKGDVQMATSGPVESITDPSKMLAKAIEMEQGSARDYNSAAQSVWLATKRDTRTNLTVNWKTSAASAPAISPCNPLAPPLLPNPRKRKRETDAGPHSLGSPQQFMFALARKSSRLFATSKRKA